jgi:hypothetical protein
LSENPCQSDESTLSGVPQQYRGTASKGRISRDK